MAYVNVPKDILKIKEKYFLGLTKRELISLIVSAILLFGAFLKFKHFIGINSLYIGFTLAFPVMFIGFYENDNIFIEDKIRNLLYFYQNNKPKVYKSENFYRKAQVNYTINTEIKTFTKTNNKRRWFYV